MFLTLSNKAIPFPLSKQLNFKSKLTFCFLNGQASSYLPEFLFEIHFVVSIQLKLRSVLQNLFEAKFPPPAKNPLSSHLKHS